MGGQDEVLTAFDAGAVAGLEPGPVERIDTHSAVVFLAGRRAYKVKRAVSYPYLDFSTLALRHRFCLREVEINRRTAPSLYEGAVPVVRDGDRFRLGGPGEPMEWVVVMRRFDQDGLFDRLAETGRLTPELLRRAVDAIVAFHATAAPAPEAGDFDWVVRENLEELRGAAPLIPAERVAAYAEACERALTAVWPLLRERRDAGWVRQAHGDLHLHNICLLEGQPTLFDAIEFNDDLACVDVLYDVGFLLMDLAYRGLSDLANLALCRYVAAPETAAGLAALPLFCSQRAAIRAKVGLSALRVTASPEPAREETRQEIRSYFALAERFMSPLAPRLVAVGGISGTGKTTLARAIAPALGGPLGALHLRTDVIRKRLAGVDDLARLPADAYTREASDRVYAAMLALADAALGAGWPVLLDAVFLDAAERRAVSDIAAAHGVVAEGLWLEAPAATLVGRVGERRGDASDATTEVVERQLRQAGRIEDWAAIDAGGGADATARAARRRLGLAA